MVVHTFLLVVTIHCLHARIIESHNFFLMPYPGEIWHSNSANWELSIDLSEVVEAALRHTSVGVRCELVWSATSLWRSSTTDTSLEISRLAEFECENSTGYNVRQKKLWLSIIPARRQWPATTHKNVWTPNYLRRNWTSRTSLESSRSQKLKYAVSAGWAKR